MTDRDGKFAGDNPFEIAKAWLAEAEATEINDPNAMALSTVDETGLPNVRVVLLKEIEENGFVFYTNYGSQKSRELGYAEKAAFVIHWKSLRRQIRVRGTVTRENGPQADAYYNSRSINSRLGAWASDQSAVVESRDVLMDRVAEVTEKYGDSPPRPEFWGGFRICPLEMEFWADGKHRLHDRFRWSRVDATDSWTIERLYP